MNLRGFVDPKSALIGATTAVATVLGMGATARDDRDNWRQWYVKVAILENGLLKWADLKDPVGVDGYEPFAVDNGKIYMRKQDSK